MRRRIISLTPLIDVVFILLVFFMLASSFFDWRTIEMGVAKAGGGSGMKGALLVEVNADGVRLSGRTMDDAALLETLRARFAEDPQQRVLIKPADGVRLQKAVDLVDRIAGAGGKQISFVSAGGG